MKKGLLVVGLAALLAVAVANVFASTVTNRNDVIDITTLPELAEKNTNVQIVVYPLLTVLVTNSFATTNDVRVFTPARPGILLVSLNPTSAISAFMSFGMTSNSWFRVAP